MKISFNGDPDITDAWNDNYYFDGISVGSLDGNPWILRNSYGHWFKLYRQFGVIERDHCRSQHESYRRLNFVRRNNVTIQLVTHFMSYADDGSVTKLLAPDEYHQIPRSRPPMVCMCFNDAGDIIYHFRSTR
jgi:hypothetical protein